MTVQQQILSALTCAALKSVARSNRVSLPLGAHKEDMVACLCALPIERLASSLDDHSLRVSLGALSRAVVGDTAMLRKRLLQAARTRQALHAERNPATEPPLRRLGRQTPSPTTSPWRPCG